MNGNVELHVLFEKLTATVVLNFTKCHLNPCTTVCNFRWFCKYQCVNRMQLSLIYGISGIFPTLTLHCTH